MAEHLNQLAQQLNLLDFDAGSNKKAEMLEIAEFWLVTA